MIAPIQPTPTAELIAQHNAAVAEVMASCPTVAAKIWESRHAKALRYIAALEQQLTEKASALADIAENVRPYHLLECSHDTRAILEDCRTAFQCDEVDG